MSRAPAPASSWLRETPSDALWVRSGSQTRVGLASFGHRRGDCADVETIRPPEPVDVARLLEPLEKLNPRGRGPLVLAIREAAKSLPPAPGKRSLVLIHDDADNCQQNVCVGAQELRAAGVTVHVVGLALKPDDLARTACLPQLTGGRLFHTQNAEQIAAAVEEALKLASNDAGRIEPPASAKGAPQPSARPGAAIVPKPPTDAPPGLYLRSLLAPKSEPVGLTLNWTVTSEGQPREVLYSGRAASPHIPAVPGRYVVEARDGPISASTVATVVDKGPTVVEVVLNAGTLRVKAQAQKSGAPLTDAIVTISEAGQGGESRKDAPLGLPLAAFKGSEGVAILPAGRYLVRVEQGLVRADRSVVVPAGSQGLVEVPLNAARLQLSAVGKEISEFAGCPHLQHCRGRPGCAERAARGGAIGRTAGRLRAGAGNLLRDRAAGHHRGPRKSGRRSGRRREAHAVRRCRTAGPGDQGDGRGAGTQ